MRARAASLPRYTRRGLAVLCRAVQLHAVLACQRAAIVVALAIVSAVSTAVAATTNSCSAV